MAAYMVSNQLEAVIQQDSERKQRRQSQQPQQQPPGQPGQPGAGMPPYRTDSM
jgi:hypothetical protein